MRFIYAAALLPVLLAACGGPAEPVWAPEAAVQQAIHRHDGPPRITLFTMTSTKNGSGMHMGMMINGSQRVIFDPAGTFRLPFAPERNDVHYGIDERALSVYLDYYARETIDVNVQEIDVTPAQAERALAAAQAYGAVPKAQCTLAITRILKEAGIGPMPVTYFPKSAMNAASRLPGVRYRKLSDTDADNNHGVLIEATRAHQQQMQTRGEPLTPMRNLAQTN